MRKKLIILGVVLVVIIIIGVVFFNLPQRLGLAQTPAEKLISATPDREAAAAIVSDLKSAGVDTRGMDIYIFPVIGTEGEPSDDNVAVAILNASEGFDFASFNSAELTGYLEKIAEAGESGDYNIERVSIAYLDESGESLITLTAPTETILKFSSGAITREQFLQEMEGQVDFGGVVKKISEMVK